MALPILDLNHRMVSAGSGQPQRSIRYLGKRRDRLRVDNNAEAAYIGAGLSLELDLLFLTRHVRADLKDRSGCGYEERGCGYVFSYRLRCMYVR